MIHFFQTMKKEYHDCTSLEGKIFYIIVPVVFCISFISIILTLLERVSMWAVASCVINVVVSAIVLLFFRKEYLYFIGLAAVTVFLTCVLFPAAFFAYGGFNSAMPSLMICSSFLCAICIRRRYGWVVFLLGLCANLATFCVAMKYPALVATIPGNIARIDYLVSFAMFSVAFYCICRVMLKHTLNYERVLSSHMDASIQKSLLDKDGGTFTGKQKVAVMFMDIAHFTSNLSQMDVDVACEYCNTFFEVCDRYIQKYNGIFDKYIGDCIMMFWVENEEETDCVYKACCVANDVCNELAFRQKEFVNRFGVKLECSVGIDYGEVIVGDIGSSSRKGFTIIGDPVNLASRLEGIADECDIYLSEVANWKIADRLITVPLEGKTKIKGIREPVQIFRLR